MEQQQEIFRFSQCRMEYHTDGFNFDRLGRRRKGCKKCSELNRSYRSRRKLVRPQPALVPNTPTPQPRWLSDYELDAILEPPTFKGLTHNPVKELSCVPCEGCTRASYLGYKKCYACLHGVEPYTPIQPYWGSNEYLAGRCRNCSAPKWWAGGSLCPSCDDDLEAVQKRPERTHMIMSPKEEGFRYSGQYMDRGFNG